MKSVEPYFLSYRAGVWTQITSTGKCFAAAYCDIPLELRGTKEDAFYRIGYKTGDLMGTPIKVETSLEATTHLLIETAHISSRLGEALKEAEAAKRRAEAMTHEAENKASDEWHKGLHTGLFFGAICAGLLGLAWGISIGASFKAEGDEGDEEGSKDRLIFVIIDGALKDVSNTVGEPTT